MKHIEISCEEAHLGTTMAFMIGRGYRVIGARMAQTPGIWIVLFD